MYAQVYMQLISGLMKHAQAISEIMILLRGVNYAHTSPSTCSL